jgi:hypothetical protein
MRGKPIMDAIAPTAERMRRGDISEIPTDRAGVVAHFASEQDALDRYYRRCELAPKHPADNAVRYEAGRRLRAAWHQSGLEARLIGSYAPSIDGAQSSDLRMVEALAASQAYARMIRLVGPVFSACVIMCCCLGEPVGPRANMEKLRMGLARLAHALGLD